jgi:localization factor PodJL
VIRIARRKRIRLDLGQGTIKRVEAMAYGNSRRKRDQESELRDVVEDAARDAGLSVDEFLDQAIAGQRRGRERRHLRVVDEDNSPLVALERRLNDAGRADKSIAEDKVAGILERAFDEIRASEQRTASILESIARNMPGRTRQPPQSVAEILQSAERRTRQAGNVVEFAAPRAPAAQEVPSLVARLEEGLSRQELERALQLLERKLSLIVPQSSNDQIVLNGMTAEIASIRSLVLAEGAHVPLAAIERPIESLTARIGALIARPAPAAAPPASAAPPQPALVAVERRLDEVAASTATMVAGIQDELVRLGRSGLNRNDAAVEASFDRLDGRIAQLEQAARAPLDHIRQQLDALHDASLRRGDGDMLRSSISSVERKLDQLTGRIAQPLRMVHNAVTQLAQQKAAGSTADAARLDQLFGELAALKRGIAEQASGFGPAGLQRQLAAISNRIESIAHRMQQEFEQNAPRDPRRKPIDDEIAEIKELISVAKSPCDDTRVLDAIAQLERKIAALENSPQALMDRLDRLQARLDERPTAGGPAIPANIELLLRNLAARLEAPTSAAVMDDAGLDRLHQEVRGLSQKLEMLPQPSAFAPPAQDLTAIERSISDLFREMDALRFDVSERAARAAADAVRDIQASPSFAAPAIATPSLESRDIEAAIGSLRQSQDMAEQRTARTLEALHETLERVVDRLGAMEREPRVAPPPIVVATPLPEPLAPPIAPAPASAAQPQAVAPREDETLNLLPPDILAPAPEPVRQRPTATMPQAETAGARSSFAETLAQLRASPAATPRAPEPKSAVASAFAAAREAMATLRSGKPAQPEAIAPPEPAPPPPTAPEQRQPAAKPAAAPLDMDILLEPGAGRPRSGAEFTAPPVATSIGPDAKADFIAAARRAAQAAAQQSAEALGQVDPKAARKARGKPDAVPAERLAAAAAPKAGLRAKHAILLGFAALLVAAGAGYTFLGGTKRAEAPAAQPPARISALFPPPAERTPAAPQAAAPADSDRTASATPQPQRGEAPRQILPPPLVAERRDAPLSIAPGPQAAPTATARETTSPVTTSAPSRVPSGAAQPVAEPSDPLFRFDGLRDAQRLREAARKGDPSAFVELGQRFADGRGANRDPKTAALWFEKAAEHGSAPAQYRLGTMFREGRGVERNAKTALKHFQASAEAGNARGMHNTAVLLAEGVNGAPDYAGAGEWFRKAAEFGVRDSQFNLAILHARGLGVAQDLMASYAWFSAAAAQGDEDAAKKRDEVGARLTPEKLRQAQAAAQQWKAKTPDPAANEITAPAGGWDTESRQAPPAAQGGREQPGRRI